MKNHPIRRPNDNALENRSLTRQRARPSDEEVVDKARRIVAAQGKARWIMLLYAAVFLGLSGFFTLAGIRRIENLDGQHMTAGFVYGLALAVVWTTFGVIGSLCLGKFVTGFGSETRPQELLVRYHDRLRDLGMLPDQQNR